MPENLIHFFLWPKCQSSTCTIISCIILHFSRLLKKSPWKKKSLSRMRKKLHSLFFPYLSYQFWKKKSVKFIKSPFLETVKIKIWLVTTSGNIDFDFTEKSQYFIGKHIRKRKLTIFCICTTEKENLLFSVYTTIFFLSHPLKITFSKYFDEIFLVFT